MGTLVLFAILFLAAYWLIKKSKSRPTAPEKSFQTATPKFEIAVSIGTSSSTGLSNPDTGPVTGASHSGWTINPKSSRPLTLLGIDEQIAQNIKSLLDQSYSLGTYNQIRALAPLIVRSNLRCKEIDEYTTKFKPQYEKYIEQLKQSTSEWASASEKDREDLLSTFRTQAISQLDIRPYCDLETIFECAPSDATIDDSLIDRFGFDNLQLYLRYADNLEKVRVVPANHYDRTTFEKLVEARLAIRGQNISTAAMLETLKLKDMKEIVADLNSPPFKKKSQAIEYLSSVQDIRERLSKVLAFRELFQLTALPQEFSSIDLSKIAVSWKYAREIATLLVHTYTMGGYSARDKERYQEDFSFITGWELLLANDDNCCPYCKRAASANYPKNRKPLVPLHLGCRCSASPILKHR